MVRIAVCDDEDKCLRVTTEMLQQYNKRPLTVESYHSGEELLQADRAYDLILLDIDMQGMSGIETAREIRKKNKAPLPICSSRSIRRNFSDSSMRRYPTDSQDRIRSWSL